MHRHHVLRLMQARPGQLFARACPARWLPLPLATGLALLLLGAGMLAHGLPLVFVLLIGLWSLACFAMAAAMPLRGGALTVDLLRGWVHWQWRESLRLRHESFSPCRLERVQLRRAGLRWPGLGWWEVDLLLDHPRLASVSLARCLTRAAAEARGRRLARLLGLHCTEAGRWSVAQLDARRGPLAVPFTHDSAQQPPPEILCGESSCRGLHFILPRQPLLETGSANYLGYALLWAGWGWSALLYRVIRLGDWDNWTPAEHAGVALLFGVSLAGVVLLFHALISALGREELRHVAGGWQFRRRWLGLSCGRARVTCDAYHPLRLVDGPAEEAGLWLPTTRGEMRVGAQLSAEALGWLHNTLLRAMQPAEPARPKERRLADVGLPVARVVPLEEITPASAPAALAAPEDLRLLTGEGGRS